MEYTNNDIKFFGRVVSAAKDGVVASAELVKDYSWNNGEGAFQSDINQQLKDLIASQSPSTDLNLIDKVNNIQNDVTRLSKISDNTSVISFDDIVAGSFLPSSSASENDGKIYLVRNALSVSGQIPECAFCVKVGTTYYANGDLVDYNQYPTDANPKPRADKLFYCKQTGDIYGYVDNLFQIVNISEDSINNLFK